MELGEQETYVPLEVAPSLEGTPPMLVIRIDGELDIATAARVRRACDVDTAAGSPVELDLAGLTFCDAAGIHALLAVRRRFAARGRRVTAVNVPLEVRRLFQVASVEDLFS
jgi:anti-sigma B factor antagonist